MCVWHYSPKVYTSGEYWGKTFLLFARLFQLSVPFVSTLSWGSLLCLCSLLHSLLHAWVWMRGVEELCEMLVLCAIDILITHLMPAVRMLHFYRYFSQNTMDLSWWSCLLRWVECYDPIFILVFCKILNITIKQYLNYMLT